MGSDPLFVRKSCGLRFFDWSLAEVYKLNLKVVVSFLRMARTSHFLRVRQSIKSPRKSATTVRHSTYVQRPCCNYY